MRLVDPIIHFYFGDVQQLAHLGPSESPLRASGREAPASLEQAPLTEIRQLFLKAASPSRGLPWTWHGCLHGLGPLPLPPAPSDLGNSPPELQALPQDLTGPPLLSIPQAGMLPPSLTPGNGNFLSLLRGTSFSWDPSHPLGHHLYTTTCTVVLHTINNLLWP